MQILAFELETRWQPSPVPSSCSGRARSNFRRESERRRSAPSADAFPAARILVVDDNEDAALALSVVLEAYGHTVHQAHDGPSSLEAAALHKPQAILLDIGLPGLDG